MKSKKVNLTLVLLWGVVAYAIALLTYCTMNNFLNSSADDISAFGSILGACGAFFAAFVATYLFNDWKEQHNKQVTNTLALQAYQEFLSFEKNTLELATYISDLEMLIHSYECELDYNTLSRSDDLIYIQNIVNKKSEMNIIFLSFLSKLRAYINIRDRCNIFDEKQTFYYSKFLSINKNDFKSNTLITDLNQWETNLLGYKDLILILKQNEINQLLSDLKV
ncbi:hypothetical protein A0109_RS06675 [Acinetobacter baumannii]|uniref:hypothetical protein n=1 Tax=Acinetobacter baumannii TaxID=470 RepID=UPI00028D897D|nr:hypothetical protein [Acinetobacter baumannii]EHU1403348.1 hypothetical protein [Acinetobacter baumannii]EHU2352747.1 hypothetical protein [Acinetobacter baumannii]EHU2373177.1 hypothetical protein [Acinetobacter baumannii]EHU2564888.1 hypothetical protein [Acinetobacter baumannii]EHU2575458.1 hypothetical protein [Acinetobacter baumannii]